MTCPRVTVITSATLLWMQNCSRPRTQASIRIDGLQSLKMDTVKGMISFMVRPLMYSFHLVRSLRSIITQAM
ncbi:hypothetical protein POSPLADRAFT_1041646, partial [Postia placenta MAD-698-R-SB12]